MKKRILMMIMVVVTVLAVMFTAACGVSNDYVENPGGAMGGAVGGSGVTGSSDIVITEDRLLVYTANMSLTVDSVDHSIKKVREYLSAAEGYESYTEYSPNSGYANFTMRVPTVNLQTFLNKLEGEGSVKRYNISSVDITEEYVSATNKRDALIAEKAALEALLEKAETLADITTITQKIHNIASQIDKYNSEISSYKKQSEYSTVYLYIYEKATYVEPNFWTEVWDTLVGSTLAVGDFFRGIIFIVVALLPFVGAVAAIFGVYVLIKFIVCKATGKKFTLFAKARERRRINKRIKELKEYNLKKKLGMTEKAQRAEAQQIQKKQENQDKNTEKKE